MAAAGIAVLLLTIAAGCVPSVGLQGSIFVLLPYACLLYTSRCVYQTGITNRDYPMIMGTTIFLATLMVTMTLITDIVYKLIDPRITLE